LLADILELIAELYAILSMAVPDKRFTFDVGATADQLGPSHPRTH
jgi:hypothetical protein